KAGLNNRQQLVSVTGFTKIYKMGLEVGSLVHFCFGDGRKFLKVGSPYFFVESSNLGKTIPYHSSSKKNERCMCDSRIEYESIANIISFEIFYCLCLTSYSFTNGFFRYLFGIQKIVKINFDRNYFVFFGDTGIHRGKVIWIH